jgi:predicted enzyme related to lactoylglutathione lyase
MNRNPVGWFEIYVQDMARAKRFYETVFQVQLSELKMPDMEMWTFPMQAEATGASGALVRMPDVPQGGNSVLIYFSCEDCAVEGRRVAGAGGKVEREKFSIGEYGFVVIARDSEGCVIGLHSMS